MAKRFQKSDGKRQHPKRDGKKHRPKGGIVYITIKNNSGKEQRVPNLRELDISIEKLKVIFL